MDPDRGHYRRLAKIKGLAAVFAPDRSTKNEEKFRSSIFRFSSFRYIFSFSSRDFHPDTRNYFHPTKIFRERRSNRNYIFENPRIKSNEDLVFLVSKKS